MGGGLTVQSLLLVPVQAMAQNVGEVELFQLLPAGETVQVRPQPSSEVGQQSGIPACEAFLGAIFLFPTIADDYDVQPGKLRHQRGNVGDWVSVVSTKSLRKYEVG